MRYYTHLFVALLMCGCAGCQTAPKGKPLTELTEAQQIEMYKYAPLAEAGKSPPDLGDILKTTGTIIICIPVALFYSMAQSGYTGQIHIGK